VRAEEGRKLNSPVLLLAGAAVDNRTLFAGERKTVPMRVSNYGDADIRNGRLSWAVMDGGRRVAGSERSGVNVPLGVVADVGDVVVDASGVRDARKLELVVSLESAGQSWRNSWDFWTMVRPRAAAPELPVVSAVRSAALRRLYPWMLGGESPMDARALLITNGLDRAALAHLKRGGRVWLLLGDSPDRRGVSYFPAAGGALGTVVASSPALAGFPNEGFCDLQFYSLLHGAYPLPIDRWPGEFEPIIGGIRTTSAFLSKTKDLSRVAFAAEAKAGGGSLLITTLRLRENLDDAYPEAIALFDSLLRYAASPAFQPRYELPAEAFSRLEEE
jgi:beta-galactosidase